MSVLESVMLMMMMKQISVGCTQFLATGRLCLSDSRAIKIKYFSLYTFKDGYYGKLQFVRAYEKYWPSEIKINPIIYMGDINFILLFKVCKTSIIIVICGYKSFLGMRMTFMWFRSSSYIFEIWVIKFIIGYNKEHNQVKF